MKIETKNRSEYSPVFYLIEGCLVSLYKVNFDRSRFFVGCGVEGFGDIGKGITVGDEFGGFDTARGDEVDGDVEVGAHAAEAVAVGAGDVDFGPGMY